MMRVLSNTVTYCKSIVYSNMYKELKENVKSKAILQLFFTDFYVAFLNSNKKYIKTVIDFHKYNFLSFINEDFTKYNREIIDKIITRALNKASNTIRGSPS